jgi:hypothetical protein
MSVLKILKNRTNKSRFMTVFALCVAVALVPGSRLRGEDNGGPKDILYIGDGGDNTIKLFNAATGGFLSAIPSVFMPPGTDSLDGPRGMIIDSSHGGSLIVASQNPDKDSSGEIVRYSIKTRQFSGKIVPANVSCTVDAAPCGPRGIISGTDHRLYVADIGNDVVGRVAQFSDENGEFLGNLDFGKFAVDQNMVYSPRGLVFGPDGMLYVSVFSKPDPLAGFILRFDNGKFIDVFASRSSCPDLHRPEGLAFGPDGKLYVTSFRSDVNDTDKILIFDLNDKGNCGDRIDLYPKGGDRAFAQALLFGPGGRLFVPVTNSGVVNSSTGDVRRYNVHDKTFDVFVKGLIAPAQLTQPWYLTFGHTDPRTLEYRE